MTIRDFYRLELDLKWKNGKKYLDHFGLTGNGKKNSDNFIVILELPRIMKGLSCKTVRFLEFS